MTITNMARTVAAIGAAALAGAAHAGPITFDGSGTWSNPPAGPGRCAPAAATVNIGPAFGPVSATSNLGSFVLNASHCINPPLPTGYFDGAFSFDFSGGDSLLGTYSGALTLSGTPGVFTNTQNYVITGGTGQYLGAIGTLTGLGTVTFPAGAPPQAFQTIRGSFAVPGAVPEPATWGMLIIGFAAIGGALRQAKASRRRPLSAFA